MCVVSIADSGTSYLDVYDRSTANAAPCWLVRLGPLSEWPDAATEKYIQNIADSRNVKINSPNRTLGREPRNSPNRAFEKEANLFIRRLSKHTRNQSWRCGLRSGLERNNPVVGEIIIKVINYKYRTITVDPRSFDEMLNPTPNRDIDPSIYSSGEINIADLTFLIDHLFITMVEVPECPKAHNAHPRTHIIYPGPDTKPFGYINAVESGNFVRGVSARWRVIPPVDFPVSTPIYEYNWKVFGPYYDDSSGVNSWDSIKNEFVKQVFVLNSGEVLPFNKANVFLNCDTIPVTFGLDSVILVILCDTVFVDTIQSSNEFRTIDTLFDIIDPSFISSSYNRVAISSLSSGNEWVANIRDTFYNIFGASPSDTTVTGTFVLWVQARELLDTLVLDPTPAFSEFSVIDPEFEHDVAVIDFQTAFIVNGINTDSARAYWQSAIDNWRPEAGYQDSLDYWRVSKSAGNVLPLDYLLSYKVVVLVSDDTKIGVINPFRDKVYIAQLAGVNVWLIMRSPLIGGEGFAPQFDIDIPMSYPAQFGIVDMVYSGWDWYGRLKLPHRRIEDFVGATSTQPNWPDLVIDTSMLHSRYEWTTTSLGWVDSLGALPEVDYVLPDSGAEVMYTYNSLYGSNHFLGAQYSFHDKPVAIRWETPRVRSAHWLFTPYAFDEAAIQPVIDSMLNWLIESRIAAEGQ